MLLEPTDDEVLALGAGRFLLRDGLLGPERAVAIARAAAALPGFRPAGISRGARLDAAVRNDELIWLDPETAPPPLPALHATLGEIGRAVGASCYLGLGRHDVQIARFPGGGARYERHLDAFAGPRSRVLTAIYYANAAWRPEHGGALRLHLPSGPLDVEPLLDRLVIFLATLVVHEVLPAHAPRLAATAWFYGRDVLS